MLEDIKIYIDEVSEQANKRKKKLGVAYGISEVDMDRYINESQYRRERSDISSLGLSWFRKTKNQDLKDKLAIEGIKKGYSVRAEKTMGAFPEYQSKADQRNFNRFDLSWEKNKNSRDFALAVEIEMDLNSKSIFKDFKKLTRNNTSEVKVMICQTKSNSEADNIASEASSKIAKNTDNGGTYLLSIWVWENASFKHYTF